MKRILLVCVISFYAVTSFAQNLNTTIKVQAMDMAKALIKKDFPTFLKYVHPNIVAMTGGKDKVLQRMDTVNAVASQLGAVIKKITVGNPGNIIKYRNELQVTIPQSSEMTSGFGNVTLETTLIAISTDDGKNWFFIDTSMYNLKEVKKAIPDLSPELIIPPPKPPKFSPAQQQ
ncbi:MAG: hypothetical protein ABJA71_17745 [Ginsengibacter sp.]